MLYRGNFYEVRELAEFLSTSVIVKRGFSVRIVVLGGEDSGAFAGDLVG